MATVRKLNTFKIAALIREGQAKVEAARQSAGKIKYNGEHHCDGLGLYLQISKSGTASWIFRYRSGGKQRKAGLGALDTFSLAEARLRARAMRQQRADGIDPIAAKQAASAAEAVEAAKSKRPRQSKPQS